MRGALEAEIEKLIIFADVFAVHSSQLFDPVIIQPINNGDLLVTSTPYFFIPRCPEGRLSTTCARAPRRRHTNPPSRPPTVQWDRSLTLPAVSLALPLGRPQSPSPRLKSIGRM